MMMKKKKRKKKQKKRIKKKNNNSSEVASTQKKKTETPIFGLDELKSILKNAEDEKKKTKTKEPATKKAKKEDSVKKEKGTTKPTTPVPATNPKQPDKKLLTQIVRLPSGLQYQDVQIGKGAEVKNGQNLKVRYKGLLQDGHVFDTNMPRGKPFGFRLGGGDVISGWNHGIAGMKIGGKRNLLLPAHLGYGAKGSPPDIPPNAPLIFEVQLISAN